MNGSRPFCGARDYDVAGFRPDAKAVNDIDARDFIRAVDQNVVSMDSGGRFRMPQSKACEHIFYEHPPKISPRPITLWIELIVTIAAVARLHFDYGWPLDCIVMQSVKWQFDITAFKTPDFTNEYIAGEVKATKRELDNFLTNLERCCAHGEHEVELNVAQANAHKKWLGLKRCRTALCGQLDQAVIAVFSKCRTLMTCQSR